MELVRFEIEGAGVAVHLAGDEEKPPLLLIHGFPSSSESFRNVSDALAQGCHVIAEDWQIMSLPGADGLGAARYLFDLDETVSRMKLLPRMEAHILDGPHFCSRPNRPNAPR